MTTQETNVNSLIIEALAQSPTLSLSHSALLELTQRAKEEGRITFPAYSVANGVLDLALQSLMTAGVVRHYIHRPYGVEYQLCVLADHVYCERVYDGNATQWQCSAAIGEDEFASASFFTKREARRWAQVIGEDNALECVGDGMEWRKAQE